MNKTQPQTRLSILAEVLPKLPNEFTTREIHEKIPPEFQKNFRRWSGKLLLKEYIAKKYISVKTVTDVTHRGPKKRCLFVKNPSFKVILDTARKYKVFTPSEPRIEKTEEPKTGLPPQEEQTKNLPNERDIYQFLTADILLDALFDKVFQLKSTIANLERSIYERDKQIQDLTQKCEKIEADFFELLKEKEEIVDWKKKLSKILSKKTFNLSELKELLSKL
jgi:hypothetical protein